MYRLPRLPSVGCGSSRSMKRAGADFLVPMTMLGIDLTLPTSLWKKTSALRGHLDYN